MTTLFPEVGMKYWDDFERRVVETVKAKNGGTVPPLRRISVHITNGCNFGCSYCNEAHFPKSISFDTFAKLVSEYSEMGGGIVHVTGGEPTVVKKFPEYIRETAKYQNVRFHLNTNFFSSVMSDDLFKHIDRLKVSLDSAQPQYFNNLVQRKNAFEVVTSNLDRLHELIKRGEVSTIVSLTYTVTKENYSHIPEFLEMYETRWPLFYASFFSSYKGTNQRFVLNQPDIDDLFNNIVPEIDRITENYGDYETQKLFHASHEERTFKTSNRFPEVKSTECYLQLSELVIDENGDLSNCSHLFRDNAPKTGVNLRDGHLRDLFTAVKSVKHPVPMHPACLYGCNKKLTTFNDVVKFQLQKSGGVRNGEITVFAAISGSGKSNIW